MPQTKVRFGATIWQEWLIHKTLFDGDLTTNATVSSGAATAVFTPANGGIEYTQKVEVMGAGSPAVVSWQLNNAATVPAVNTNDWVVLDTGSGRIDSITLSCTDFGLNWTAVRVDGKVLVDKAFDDQVWSEQTTSTFLSGYKADKAFNGVLDGNNGCIGNNQFTFDFTGLTINSSFRVFGVQALRVHLMLLSVVKRLLHS